MKQEALIDNVYNKMSDQNVTKSSENKNTAIASEMLLRMSSPTDQNWLELINVHTKNNNSF